MQPCGQLPLTGFEHWMVPGPTSMKQQSCPAAQHWLAQQNVPAPQVVPVHGGVPQVPAAQYGFCPVHAILQPPQLAMSLFVLTQKPPQHLNSEQSVSV